MANGYQVIRIDCAQVLRINDHLDYAQESDSLYQVSTPSLYENWLSGEIFVDEYQRVLNSTTSHYTPKENESN